MKQLDSRIFKIEKEVYRVHGIKTFMHMVASTVAQADPDGGKRLTKLLAARKTESVKNPGKLITTLTDVVNHLGSDARDRTIEILMTLRDVSKGETE